LRVIDVKEDEDLLNVGTWEDGGTKQWCKFDLPDPTEFQTVIKEQPLQRGGQRTCKQGMCGDIGGDPKWHKEGVAKVFYTAHHAVDPAQTKRYLDQLRETEKKKILAPPILFHNKFFANSEELKKAFPELKCII